MLSSQKYDLKWGLNQLREVWTKNFKTSPAEEDDVEMTGDGEGSGEQVEGCLLEKPIPYISNDNFSQEGIFDYWNVHLSGHAHVKRTYPDVVKMWRQFHGCPGSGDGIKRVFTGTGKQYDDHKKGPWIRRWKSH